MAFRIDGQEFERGLPAKEALQGIMKLKNEISGKEEGDFEAVDLIAQLGILKGQLRHMLSDMGWVTLGSANEARHLADFIEECHLDPPRCYLDSQDDELKWLAQRMCKQVVMEVQYKVRGLVKR